MNPLTSRRAFGGALLAGATAALLPATATASAGSTATNHGPRGRLLAADDFGTDWPAGPSNWNRAAASPRAAASST